MGRIALGPSPPIVSEPRFAATVGASGCAAAPGQAALARGRDARGLDRIAEDLAAQAAHLAGGVNRERDEHGAPLGERIGPARPERIAVPVLEARDGATGVAQLEAVRIEGDGDVEPELVAILAGVRR